MKEIALILLLQLIYVPIFTLRTIFLVKGMSVTASFLGFMEALVYVFGLSLVFGGDKSDIALVVYAVGFGIGIFIGGLIERKLAIGYTTFIVNLMNNNQELIAFLRNEGFGVTVYEGQGRDSKRYRLEILTKRSREEELLNHIEGYEPKAFIISYEPRKFRGGFLIKDMKKRMKNRK
ncbi:DUF2179 domain-containing protein [Petroclostridium sp. X23]|uniref:DUF2179 domain-containing protein n=1 Tax=Petroclostridium sp. X23 TaxID=3045146 RepID=UPI0024AD8AF6|nr:DUF2179 domain-containing protein [Petroclostridium sp. X23]WHH57618.1 DUF2179 domain-containing protein [Petroclostridium sp. X23]